MIDIISKIIPILLLIIFGRYIRYKKIFSQAAIDEIKNVVINIALSAVLFITFLNMELKLEYFIVSMISFALLNTLYFIGFVAGKIKGINYPVTPYFTSGCAFGLLGIPLFTTVFGVENLGQLSILGAGNEFFIWIILFTVMRMRFKKEKFSLVTAKQIIKSPLIISIIFGITFNLLGLSIWVRENPFGQGLYLTLEYLSNLATPLILIIIGYGLKFNKKYIRQSAKIVALRMFLLLTVGYIFKYYIIDNIMPPDKIFDYAYFTFLILPAPFAIPMFIGNFSTKENEELANNTVVMSTLFSIAVYFLFIIMI